MIGWKSIAGMPPRRYAMVGRWCGHGGSASSVYWNEVRANWAEHNGEKFWSYEERNRPSPFYDAEGNYAEPSHYCEIPEPPPKPEEPFDPWEHMP